VDGNVIVECAIHGSHGILGGIHLASREQECWTMKRYLLQTAVIFALLVSSSAIFAQEQDPSQSQGQVPGGGQGHGPMKPMTADERLQRMTKQLNLTDAQQQQIKPILENESQQMQALRNDSSVSQDDRMSKMMQIHKDSATQIKPILTADQQQKYEQMMNRRGRGPEGPPPNQGQDQPPPQ
jgi:protein CpxP